MSKHNNTCTMAFGRKSKHDDCSRCNELKAGAEPVKWNVPAKRSDSNSLAVYCFSVSMLYGKCTAQSNPTCACGKMSYTD